MEEGKKVIVKQVRSQHGKTPKVRSTLTALGLRRIGQSQEHTLNKAIIGMLDKVRHLVQVRYV
ncbi:MAG: 50S ribosomal protein L30 [Bdellovibrionales bacterium]|nr:50S ribosomal protein L30 [Bdellovibrionales bacterium]